MNPGRRLAWRVIHRVTEQGAYSQHALRSELDHADCSPADRARAAELVYGTLTWWGGIDGLLEAKLPRGLSSLPAKVRAALRVGTYELQFRTPASPAHAAVHETVEGVRVISSDGLAGVANAVLRQLSEPLPAPNDTDEATALARTAGLPTWLARILLARLDDPARAASVMAAFNAPSSTHVRVRPSTTGAEPRTEALLAELVAVDTDNRLRPVAHPHVPDCIVMSGHVAATDAHREGRISIHDAGAQWATMLLPAKIEGAILDCCAGVGGKSEHLRDRYPDARIVCTDAHAAKLQALKERLRGVNLEVTATAPWRLPDAAPAAVHRRAPYEAIVLDAPCSGLGTIGRHPEVRWTRKSEDVDALVALQAQMLDTVAPLVAPGGWLVYIVCTWTKSEGPMQIARFLERNPEFVMSPPDPEGPAADDPRLPWAQVVDAHGGITLWPDTEQTDGFYAARLQRLPS